MNITVRYSSKPLRIGGTNGHEHFSPAPPSSTIKCSGPSQYCQYSGYSTVYSGNTQIYTTTWPSLSVEVRLSPGSVGQAERIAVTAQNTGWGNYADYVVGYNDIYWTDHPEIWVQIGGNTTQHGDNRYNHWMKTSAAYGLYDCTLEYLRQVPEQVYICTNDMSLPFGGLFDLNRDWNKPHTFHRKGDSADIAMTANQCSYPVSAANAQTFLTLCMSRFNALPIQGSCGGSCIEGNHLHFRWDVQ